MFPKPSRTTRRIGRELTKREQEITDLVLLGQRDKEIATALRISAHTVRFHIGHVFQKLGVASRVKLIVLLLGPKARYQAWA